MTAAEHRDRIDESLTALANDADVSNDDAVVLLQHVANRALRIAEGIMRTA